MTRNEARQKFKDAGLTYAVITPAALRLLRSAINQRMKDSGLIRGTFRCRERGVIQTSKSGRFFAGINCRSFYFDNREAVSFNDDGFIGFAGWSDDENIKPILEGFCEWVETLKSGAVESKGAQS